MMPILKFNKTSYIAINYKTIIYEKEKSTDGINNFFVCTVMACKKNSPANQNITVANIAGSYKLAGLIWINSGVSINIYDSLQPCSKDDLYKLNADLSYAVVDAGIVCAPPDTDSGVWRLSNDSLYFTTTASTEAAKINSFTGSILIFSGYVNDNGFVDSTTIAKETFVKQ
jgi:hypothetical protein